MCHWTYYWIAFTELTSNTEYVLKIPLNVLLNVPLNIFYWTYSNHWICAKITIKCAIEPTIEYVFLNLQQPLNMCRWEYAVELTIENVGRVESCLFLLQHIHIEGGPVTHLIIRVQLWSSNQQSTGQITLSQSISLGLYRIYFIIVSWINTTFHIHNILRMYLCIKNATTN